MGILKKNKPHLDRIAQELLKKEVLSKEEFDAFFETKKTTGRAPTKGNKGS